MISQLLCENVIIQEAKLLLFHDRARSKELGSLRKLNLSQIQLFSLGLAFWHRPRGDRQHILGLDSTVNVTFLSIQICDE